MTRESASPWRRDGPALIQSLSSTEQQQDYGARHCVWRMQNGIAAFASPHLELRDGAGEMLRLDPWLLPRFCIAVGVFHACPGGKVPASGVIILDATETARLCGSEVLIELQTRCKVNNHLRVIMSKKSIRQIHQGGFLYDSPRVIGAGERFRLGIFPWATEFPMVRWKRQRRRTKKKRRDWLPCPTQQPGQRTEARRRAAELADNRRP
ncbi:hypothetical protein TgHK011_004008 [Trichoderma gracile]|nr:hypothetical protein TgHK011_004008 [Trichoderma gracile]